MHSSFPRQLGSEILDDLAEDDPRAVRSRRDLQRINRVMGSAGILCKALSRAGQAPRRMLELGAGDGSLMLRLARRLAPAWPNVHVTLLDRQDLVGNGVRQEFARLGWTVEVMRVDVLDWIRQPAAGHWDIAMANLFIHHFDAAQIRQLFDALGERTDLFVACEPRRGLLPLLSSRLVGLIGANDVTRTDAVLSVRAGFCGSELSACWPGARSEWQLDEKPARLFSHVFCAQRKAK